MLVPVRQLQTSMKPQSCLQFTLVTCVFLAGANNVPSLALITKANQVGLAELLLRANGAGRARETKNGRVGGVSLEALKAHVPGGNWVALGFDFPLVRR